MATTAPAGPTEDPELPQTAWDLEPLVDGEGQEGVARRLSEALERAKTFASRYAGQLGGLDSAGLRDAMNELAAIHELEAQAAGRSDVMWLIEEVRVAQLAPGAYVRPGGTVKRVREALARR